MMDDCVVFPGERPRRDPGPMRPSGNRLYARTGGVYPIALFVDRLVDALLADDRVHILLATAEVAADHLPAAVRPSLLQVLESNRRHIVDSSSTAASHAPSQPQVAAAVKDVRAAA